MKSYSKMPIDVINSTNFIVVSSRIRITKDRDNVLSASHLLINGGHLKGVDINLDIDSDLMKKEFKYFLLKNPKSLALLVSMIECDIVEGENSVLLCTPNEMKCGYLKVIADVVWDLFHYKIYKYPANDVCTKYDKKDVIKRLIYYKKQIKKIRFATMSDGEKLRYVQNLSNKELKKELKKRKEDYEGLDRKEKERLLLEVM